MTASGAANTQQNCVGKGNAPSGAAGGRTGCRALRDACVPSLALIHHAGCGNHGCEAIVRSLLAEWSRQSTEETAVRLITNSAAEDHRYLPAGLCAIEEERHIDRHFFAHAACYAWRRLTGDRESFLRYRFPMLLGKGLPGLAVSIGGDNYCYPDMVPDLILTDRMLSRRGVPTVLLGCSVEPDALAGRDAEALIRDMQGHRLILARESLTHTALLEAGVEPERLRLLPDPAFSMETGFLPLPEGFDPENTVGLNVSPLIEQYRTGEESALEAFAALIAHITDNTKLRVALIPHVVWPSSDDRKPLQQLMDRFADTGRVLFIGDHSAPELKGFIARCRFFVGARTHATIAAYSSLVPTLVVGYSVKSEGIARDLFGTAEGLVLPVRKLTGKRLIDAFEDLRRREEELRGILTARMPEITENAKRNAHEVLKQWKEAAAIL